MTGYCLLPWKGLPLAGKGDPSQLSMPCLRKPDLLETQPRCVCVMSVCELGPGCRGPWLCPKGSGRKASEHRGPEVGAVHAPLLAEQAHNPACLL